ncbi:hypothetical protein P152DRAFT_156614 [Eremomyces bilateralis CBS 781.70]|uniref:Uncharacterized protein n=1 Tax=Eremomyces bilateralis CBS 781.70 TaxID=1392243 RepID=A0A6G1FVJ2_9PEZI|nr:uncharacterized protein P152DRAFT_156614 [Eremomyces bilateralis CBS 781.70]KAF1809681.1 hypothetical protein P152DRAFT_156614 [Eremomyces bilateralis CBS 781.70]
MSCSETCSRSDVPNISLFLGRRDRGWDRDSGQARRGVEEVDLTVHPGIPCCPCVTETNSGTDGASVQSHGDSAMRVAPDVAVRFKIIVLGSCLSAKGLNPRSHGES